MSQPDSPNPSQPDAVRGSSDARQAPDIWDLALDDLRYTMTRETFHAHLSGSWPRDWQPGPNAWVIVVRNSYSPGWLSHRLDRVVRRTLARHTPGLPEPSLTYLAAPSQAGAGQSGTMEEVSQDAGGAPIEDRHGPTSEERHDPTGEERRGPTGEERHALTREDRHDPTGGDPIARGAAQGASGITAQAAAQSARPKDARPDSAAWKARLQPTDIYIKLKTSFRERALRRLKGAKLSVFMCLILHMDRDGTAAPGIERIMRETGHARGTVCRALDELASPPLSLVEKVPASRRGRRRGCIRMADCYRVRGYAWFGPKPAVALYEEEVAM